MLMTADTVLTGRELLRPGWIEVSQGTVAAVGDGRWRPGPRTAISGAVIVVPGFVDTHLHGGGGANFSDRVPRRHVHRRGVSPQARHHHTRRLSGHRGPGRPATAGRGTGRRRSCRPDRRDPSGRSVAFHQAVRRPPAVADARPGPRRDRPRSRCGWRGHSHGHHRAGTRRRPSRDRADRRCGRGGRGGPHRGDL